jgi:outer membrane biosynthesis protein TonB
MKSASKIAVLVLLCLIAGCKHKTQAAPPPAAQAPILPPSESAKTMPPPSLPPEKPLEVKPPGSDQAQQQPPPKPHKTAHRKPKPADTTQTSQTAGQAPATAQTASAGEAPAASPIGQLSSSSASDGGSIPSRREIQDKIAATESGLNGIKRSLSSEEQLTVTEIRTFITKARKALVDDDLDGANTLATKAKVLLEELTKS